MTSCLAAALDFTGMSDRNALYVLSKAVASMCHNPTEFNFSHESVRRQRNE